MTTIPYKLVSDPVRFRRLIDLQEDLQRSVQAVIGGKPLPIISEAINAAIVQSIEIATDGVRNAK